MCIDEPFSIQLQDLRRLVNRSGCLQVFFRLLWIILFYVMISSCKTLNWSSSNAIRTNLDILLLMICFSQNCIIIIYSGMACHLHRTCWITRFNGIRTSTFWIRSQSSFPKSLGIINGSERACNRPDLPVNQHMNLRRKTSNTKCQRYIFITVDDVLYMTQSLIRRKKKTDIFLWFSHILTAHTCAVWITISYMSRYSLTR